MMGPRNGLTRILSASVLALVVLGLALAACSRAAAPVSAEQASHGGLRNASLIVEMPPTPAGGTGLSIRLSEASEQGRFSPVPTVAASPLDAGQIQAVLDRLPTPPPPETGATTFNRPPTSMPAPRAGKTVTDTFPPVGGVAAIPTVAPAALAVVRHSPDGPVPIAPALSATFNQPMVALTGLEDLAAGSVPVELEPQVPGRWRWVGTQTLLFEPLVGEAQVGDPGAAQSPTPYRFPMATVYTATVPAGSVSAGGARLAQPFRWTFTTPPPQLSSSYPSGGPQRLDPILFAEFDQRIDPAAVLKATQIDAGQRSYQLRMASADEIKADQALAGMVSRAAPGRWLAFRASEAFPPDTQVTVAFPAGLPSAEGPRRSETAQSFNFRTYGPFRLVESRCGWDSDCRPFMPWALRFTNPIDSQRFDDSLVRIDPPVPGAQIDVFGDTLSIRGTTQGRTTYRVTVSSALRDVFGQTLGADQTVTFKVGSAEPALFGGNKNIVVLDPAAKPAYSVYSINIPRLKVQVNSVTPADWAAYQLFLRSYNDPNAHPVLPGRQVIARTVNVEAQADQIAETVIDLSSALSEGLGQLVLLVEPDPPFPPDRGRQGVHAWVQSTRIGLDAFADGEQMQVWANSLVDGSPLDGVQLTLLPGNGEPAATTASSGLAALPLPGGSGANLLVARRGGDLAILPQNEYYWNAGEPGWRRVPPEDELRWYVFDDRQMYRPGEEVHIKGWLRRVTGGPAGDVEPAGASVQRISYTLNDSRGNKLLDGETGVNVLGGFDFAFKIPPGTNLGPAGLHLVAVDPGKIAGFDYTHNVQVEEFRRPEFEVKAEAGAGPYFVGASAVASVQADYYAGGGLPNADVTWNVSSAPGSYSPPNWDDYTFGIWHPWWLPYESGPGQPPFGKPQQTFAGHTDSSGAHRLRLDFQSVDPPQPSTVTANATVMDVNRQAWTASTTMLVHPSSLYVGLRTPRLFVEREQPLPVDAIVVDLDGNVVPGVKIEMKAARLDWQYRNGTWSEVEKTVQPCTVTSTKDPVRCTFETPEGGTYRITATVIDKEGRPNLTQITRWVSGGGRPPSREVEQEQVTLIPDRKNYADGDTAEILVQAPFYPAEGTLTLRRSGLVATERFSMTGPGYTLRVPIKEAYVPDVTVQVDLVGTAPRLTDAGEPDPKLPRRPAYATGSLDLPVPPLARTLKIAALPRDAGLEPGGTTTVDLQVSDATGKPVAGAEAAVVVVDEAVLALTGYQMPDPLAVFYARRQPGVQDVHSRAEILLANPAQLADHAAAPAATQTVEKALSFADGARAVPAAAPTMAPAAAEASGAAANGAAPQPIAVRSDFNALATFAPALRTGADGRVQVEVKLPDNLTRYRVMAVAVSGGKQFGQAESSITARLPLMVRPSAPRYLNFGDRFEFPVVLQNQTGRPLTATVAMRATNAQLVRPGALRGSSDGYTVMVPANDRVEVRFPATTVSPGTARFQVAAVSGKAADAADVSLPVYTPATTEAFATYGVIDDGAIAQPVIAPSQVYTQFGGLQVTTSSTALQALTDAVLYLTSYPYECSEQLASRILGVASLRDVLTAFQAEGLPSPAAMNAAVERDVLRLRGMQNDDGGFPFWQRGDPSWPYNTVHVAHALARAKAKGYAVPPDMLDRVQPYLTNIEQHLPAWYGIQARRSIVAYSLYVRKLLGETDLAKARQLADEGLSTQTKAGAEISSEALGWLLATMTGDPASQRQVEAIRLYLANHVVETAGAANFVTSYGDDSYLLMASDRRADAVILDALISDQPNSDLIPKIVAGLLAHRVQGRWANTEENVFVLVALDRYFNAYESVTPDFVARVWLGDSQAGEHSFRGYTTERAQIDVPMADLAGKGGAAQDLLLAKDGAGRLYYRLGMSYAPLDLNMKPLDAGFTVQRTYEAIDDPADVRRSGDGTWHIRPGARVRVRLSMVAPSRRYHVALVDPLPAGFEALNPALAVVGAQVEPNGGPLPVDGAPTMAASAPAPAVAARPEWDWGRWWTWYDHQNLRDDRAEAFTSLLWDGVYDYTYIARATTPGSFVVPPAKAEEMYSPETFGRSGTDRVVIE